MARDTTRHHEGDETIHYVSERQKRSRLRQSRAMQPPLTPMIDVTFLLLVFFLLACQFKVSEGVILAKLPAISGPEARPALDVQRIEIIITRAGVDGQGAEMQIKDVGVAENIARLRKMLVDLRAGYSAQEQPPVVIKPDADVRWQYPVDAFNQAVIANYESIAFAPAQP
ncbi:MAG TPA: biopolymer transporter ExbD [Phycisphaerae bacterium]|nr:biopolymer transporter ExbD [Phycisphaerae bacterium]